MGCMDASEALCAFGFGPCIRRTVSEDVVERASKYSDCPSTEDEETTSAGEDIASATE